VLLIGTAPYLISTAKAKSYKTLADVIAFAKENPGKVSYGSVGSGSLVGPRGWSAKPAITRYMRAAHGPLQLC